MSTSGRLAASIFRTATAVSALVFVLQMPTAVATTTVVTPGNSAGMLYLGRETNQTARAPRCDSRKRVIALMPGSNCLDVDGQVVKVVSVIRVNNSATTPPLFQLLVAAPNDSVAAAPAGAVGDGRFLFPTTTTGGVLGVGANTNANGGCGGTTTSPDNLFGCPTTPSTLLTEGCPTSTTGWRWPYGGELALMFAARATIGGFGGTRYWSAHYNDPGNTVTVWLMPFRTPTDVNPTLDQLLAASTEIKGRFRQSTDTANERASLRCVKLITIN